MNTLKPAIILGTCAALALSFPSFGDDATPPAPGAGTETGGPAGGRAKHGDKRAEAKEKAEAKRADIREKIEEKKTAQEDRKAQIEARRAEWAKLTPEQRKAKIEARKAEMEKMTPEERKAKIEARKAAAEKKAPVDQKRTDTVNSVTDKREANQEKRIQHGISKGYLTPEETAKLEQQQQNIEKMQQQFNGDGKVTRDEAKDLRNALNDASFDIWTQKHDTDGNQMAAYRLGKNVFLKPELASRLGDENLSRADARRFLGDFHSLAELKKKLNGDLSAEERAKLQERYDILLNQYFTTK